MEPIIPWNAVGLACLWGEEHSDEQGGEARSAEKEATDGAERRAQERERTGCRHSFAQACRSGTPLPISPKNVWWKVQS